MKDSGVAWIGEIPEEWTVRRLKNFASIQNGMDYRKVFDEGGEFPVIGSGGAFAHASQFMYDKTSVLLGRKGTVDKPIFIDCPFWTVDTMYYTVIHEDVSPRYFYYLCTQIPFTYFSYGSAVPSMTQRDLNSVHFPYPPKTEQEAMATYLDECCESLQETIDEAQNLVDKLTAYKQSLITEAVTKGLHPEVARKDSGDPLVGEIPASWKFISLKYLLASGRDSMRVGPFGSQLKGQDFQEEGVPVFTQKTVLDNDFFHGDTFISQEKYEQLKSFAVEAGDILITTRGSIGKIAVAPPDVTCGILHPCVIRFRTDKSKVMDEFLKYVFNETDLLRQQLLLKSNATTIDVVYSYALKCVSLAVPPLEEQREIVSYLANKCAAIDADIARRRKLIERLSAYRRSLIYEVVTGKREVV